MPDSMDWVKSGMRCCDSCGRETDAGEWPDWPDGICEDCDPDILLDYFDCDWCNVMLQSSHMKVVRKEKEQSELICSNCWDNYKKEVSNA